MATIGRRQRIQEIVAQVIDTVREEHGGARLAPFTLAEIRFLQEVLARSLAALLDEGDG